MHTRVEIEPTSTDEVEVTTATATDTVPSPTQIWERATEVLRSELPEGHFAAWFGRAHPVTLDGTSFVLAVPSTFVKEWIEARYLPLMRAVLSRFVGREVSVMLLADETLPEATAPPELPPEAVAAPDVISVAPVLDDLPDFHPKYNFESFVIGSSNRFAHAAAQAVAEAPAEAYNPLFIYGEAGLGKTHLLHAIGRYVRDCHRNLVVQIGRAHV